MEKPAPSSVECYLSTGRETCWHGVISTQTAPAMMNSVISENDSRKKIFQALPQSLAVAAKRLAWRLSKLMPLPISDKAR